MAEETTTAPTREELPQRILVLRDFCVRPSGGECNRCELACPVQALSFSPDTKGLELPRLNEDICTQCGICLGVCDAFTSTRVTMLDLRARMKRIALRGEEVVITCQENIFPDFEPAPNVVVLPCLASLSPEFWTALLADDLTVSIAGDLSYCTDCTVAPQMGEALSSHAIETAEKWTEKTVGFYEEIPEKTSLVAGLASSEEYDRRGIISNLVEGAADIASGQHRLRNSEVLQQFHEQQERMKARLRLSLNDSPQLNRFAPLGHTKQTMHPKRQLLLEAINNDPALAARVPVSIARVDEGLCTNSLDCTKLCPTSALYPQPDTGKLVFDSRYCIGCGICASVCKQHAITLETTTAEVFKTSAETDKTTETD